jgi:hypothetical protein
MIELELKTGLEEEIECSKEICTKIIHPIIKPKEKCNTKILFTITIEEHQIYSPMYDPIKGIILTILIITVIPQYDICPQFRIYPKKQSINKHKKITQPDNHIQFNSNLINVSKTK